MDLRSLSECDSRYEIIIFDFVILYGSLVTIQMQVMMIMETINNLLSMICLQNDLTT